MHDCWINARRWLAEYWIYSSIESIVCSDLTEQNDDKPLTYKHIHPPGWCDVYQTKSCQQRLIYTQTWTYSTLYPCTFPFTIFTDCSSHCTFSQWFFFSSVHSFLSWYNIIHITLKMISSHICDVPLLFFKLHLRKTSVSIIKTWNASVWWTPYIF